MAASVPDTPPLAANRRGFLSRAMGGLTLSGLWARQLWGESQTLPAHLPPLRACIVVFYYGGPSHLDTFDMKPSGPAEIRGEFQPRSTTVPGLMICEHLPLLARQMEHLCLIRSMHHGNRLHDSASTEVLTGRPPLGGDRENFAPTPQFHPCHGAAVHEVFHRRDDPRLGKLQAADAVQVFHAALPWKIHNVIDVPCQGGGFLGPRRDPLWITGDPEALRYASDSLRTYADLPRRRLEHRRVLLERLQTERLSARQHDDFAQLAKLYDRASQLLGSKRLHEALLVEREPARVRARYGMTQELPQHLTGNGAHQARGLALRGQNLLLARRLVEAGVPFVNVYDFRQQGQNWDSHADNFGQHKHVLLPAMDRSLSALIEDLQQRGLLETTLVVAMGEFGRTPKINANAGRDHWPDCYSLVLAGGGIRGGRSYGASDKSGAFPVDAPVTPADLAATIYWRFGIAPETEIHEQNGRPHRIAQGRPLRELFA